MSQAQFDLGNQSTWNIHQGDVLDWLPTLPENHFDAAILDPPSGIGFMNLKWDSNKGGMESWILWFRSIASGILRALKPGAYALVWSIPKTSHWTGYALETAGFEVVDVVAHAFGSGMPKNHNISLAFDKKAGKAKEREVVREYTVTGNAGTPLKEKGGTYGTRVANSDAKTLQQTKGATEEAKLWDNHGTALKPAMEFWWLVRKPLDGTFTNNCSKWGVGGINIGGTRIKVSGSFGGSSHVGSGSGYSDAKNNRNAYGLGGTVSPQHPEGRWPSHFVLSHHADCDDLCVEDCPVAILNRQSGNTKSTLAGRADPTQSHGNPGDNGGKSSFGGGNSKVYADQGGASRFFYCAKPSSKERDAGVTHFERKTNATMVGRKEGSVGINNGRAGAGRTSGACNNHPTLKPIELTTYLATLLLPPSQGVPRRILNPFTGSGTEMIGSLRAGWEHVEGCELSEEFITIANTRIPHWLKLEVTEPPRKEPRKFKKPKVFSQLNLFGDSL